MKPMGAIKNFFAQKIVKDDVGEETFLTWKELISYAVGRGAQGMSTSMMSSSYVNYFLTNILRLNTNTVGNIRLFAGAWDAINDPLLGVMVDKTRTKHGKMRPYIKFAPFVSAFFTMLFFSAYSWPASMRLVVAIIAYVGWDMAYTAVDVPMGALAFSITPSRIERTKLFGYSSIVRAIISAIPAGFVAIALMIPSFQENTAPAYLIAATMSAVGMIVLTRFTFHNTTERAQYSEDAPSLKECFYLLIKNRPLFMLFLSNIFYLLCTVPSGMSMYFAIDLMGSGSYVLPLQIASAPAPFLAGLLLPKIVEKLGAKADFKKIYTWCCLLAGAIHVVFFLSCRSGLLNKEPGTAASLPVVIMVVAFTALSLIPLEFKNLCVKEMEAETVDYVEWKTGQRAEGVMLSIMSFTGKITNSFSSSIALYILAWAGYKTHETAIAVAQTPLAQSALFSLYTIVPLAGYLLMLVPIIFYNITGDGHKQMLADIAARREAAGGDADA